MTVTIYHAAIYERIASTPLSMSYHYPLLSLHPIANVAILGRFGVQASPGF
jgi:hypothetical protein